jgi:hypothetical protein
MRWPNIIFDQTYITLFINSSVALHVITVAVCMYDDFFKIEELKLRRFFT